MKKLTLLFCMAVFTVHSFAGQLVYTYYFESPAIVPAGDYQVISFENTYLTGKTGEPSLPYQGIRLLLPPGEEAVAVHYSFLDETQVEENVLLYPHQPSRPLSEGPDGIFHQNMAVYRSMGSYPACPRGEFSTHFMNGHSVLLSTFTPVTYIPLTGQISYFKKVTVTVTTSHTQRATRAAGNLNFSAGTSNRIRSFVQNSDMLRLYPAEQKRDNGYQVLIVAPQVFQITLQQMQALYLVRGLKSEIVTTEYINTNTSGQDLPEKIRNYIIQEYQQNGIEYVLLGGDTEHVPFRGFYCYVQSGWGYEDNNIPSDVYYSALDGNWNTDGDGSWGEIGEDDLLPDVAVARFPASTADQLQKLITKTTRYQDQPVTGELRNPLMAGEELYSDPLTYGEDYLELLIGWHDDNGYTTDGIPENHNFQKMYDHLEYWGGNDLIAAVNQGRSFIHHSGHANQTYVMRLDISEINNSTFSQVDGTNHNYSLVYTHGCLCGAFDENDCIGEAMVLIDHFAVAGAFNSRYGWFNEGQTEGPSAHLHREFVDALYTDRENHIGTAHMISKIEASTWVNAPGQWEEGALRWCFYCCNFFGDPVLRVWTDEPMEIETTYPEEVLASTTSVPVTVTTNGQPVSGDDCVVMGDGEMLGLAVTDAGGQAVIDVPGGFAGISSAELVVSGYNCLPHHYPLSIQVGLSELTRQDISISNHPNPFREETKLLIKSENTLAAEIILYLSNGQEAWRKGIVLNKGENYLNPDITHLPEGMIVVELITGNQVMHHKMIRISK